MDSESTTVEVPERYIPIAKREASKRNRSFERSGHNERTDDWDVDPEDRNFVGVMGELAFAEYADLKIDTSRYAWSDRGADFEVEIDEELMKIDVKTAQKEPPALMVEEESVNADYYVLAHLEDRMVTFYGGATADRVMNGVRRESRYGHVNYTPGVDYLDNLPEPDEIIEYDQSL